MRLYIRFIPSLRHFFANHEADRELCDELVQRLFVYLWVKREDFSADASFEKYLFHIARNTLNKETRRARRHAELDPENLPHANDDSNHVLSEPEARLYAKELADAIERAKAELTDKQRQALEASQAVDMPLSKVLKELGCSYDAFEKLLQRARKRMRELLECFLNDENDPDRLQLTP